LSATPLAFDHDVTARFLRYVVIDTQSDPASPTCPSTAQQMDLGAVLVRELLELGLADAHMDACGYVYATIPATSDKAVPVICFCSHMDTSPDCSGKDVRPKIVRNYQGGDIVLPADATQVIRVRDNPALVDQIGHDIITTDGTTLLGADNKAGLAEIMDAARFLVAHPEISHGAIKILFTPDEEIGRGVDKVDLDKLGADFAYTMDGETAGHIEDETFSADGAVVTITGVATHPGFARGKMEHAIKIAAAIVERLPKDTCSPESTEGKEGFLHPIGISGALEQTTLSLIVRDFTEDGLAAKAALLQAIIDDVLARLSALHRDAGDHAAIPQHEAGDRPLSAYGRLRYRGDPPHRPHAGARQHPRRHRRLAAVFHGPALPEHFCRRTRLPRPHRMGFGAGHGEGGGDHRASGDGVGRAGIEHAAARARSATAAGGSARRRHRCVR
jgi:tripeptide aminopeptidase